MSPINAETLAIKLQDAEFATEVAEHPRRRELLWFIQWKSWQPGGLVAMVQQIVTDYSERLGTAAMLRCQPAQAGKWTLKDCLSVWKEAQQRLLSSRAWLGRGFVEWIELHVDDTAPALAQEDNSEEMQRLITALRISARESKARDIDLAQDGKLLSDGLEKFNCAFFIDRCRERILNHLPGFFASLCGDKDRSFAYHSFDGGFKELNEFADLYAVLFDYMDRQAAERMKALGKNRVTEMVFRRLDYSQSAKYPVIILGDARIGKTKSVSTWCNMRPGLARLVTVPDANREWEFFAAHADALGIPYDAKTGARTLKRTVEFAMRESGLFFIYDEFHFAIPTRYSRNTAPPRLNWIRSQVIDRGLGCAFFATRQTYNTTMEKYVSATQFQMEQWIGRIAPPLILPAELDHCEMLEAAKALFPGMDADYLALIVERCVQKESGFRYLKPVASYAQWLARQAGREQPDLEDVDGALDEMLTHAPDASAVPASPARPQRVKPAPALRPPRATTPQAPIRRMESDLSVRSLQPDCPQVGEVEQEIERA